MDPEIKKAKALTADQIAELRTLGVVTEPDPPELTVAYNYQTSKVVISLGEKQIALDIGKARDFALAIRMASNRLEKANLARGVKPKNKRSR